MTRYHRHVIWNIKNDALVRVVFNQTMGYRIHKSPRVDRLTGSRMVGVHSMTELREKELKALLGRKIKIVENVPKLFWVASETPHDK